MNLVTDKAIFNTSLKKACLIIAIFFLCSIVLGAIFHPSYVTHSSSLVGFILQLVGNIALLVGAHLENQWLVLVWLIQAALFFIGWPFAVLGVIFNYGDYRYTTLSSNIFLSLLEYIIVFVFFAYCTYLVYSFFYHLRNRQSSPQHAVVV